MLNVDLQLRRHEFTIDVKFAAPTPGITALFGRSGAGKTTLIQLIAGLLRADTGSIDFDGQALFNGAQNLNVPPHARGVGCVFQELRLFPHLNVAGNLRYGLRRAAPGAIRIPWDRVIELLDLGALLERRIWQLSGGERQRVALARALLAQPRLLLLDEPLSAIDSAQRSAVLPYFERLRDELTLPMLLVTHHFDDVVRLATHVVLLDGGRVLTQGDLPAVSLKPELGALLGSAGIGAVVVGRVESVDANAGLATVSLGVPTGKERLLVPSAALVAGRTVQLQLLARDLILATEQPRGLSVRNQLRGTVTQLSADPPHNTLVSLDAGGVRLLARVTSAAALELQLHVGQPLWILVKSVSLRGHAVHGP